MGAHSAFSPISTEHYKCSDPHHNDFQQLLKSTYRTTTNLIETMARMHEGTGASLKS